MQVKTKGIGQARALQRQINLLDLFEKLIYF